MSRKKPPLTKGNDEPVKMPKPKHVQVLRGLAIKVLRSTVPEHEHVSGEKVPYLYAQCLNNTIIAMGYDPDNMVPQMIKNGYLVPRTREPDQISFYILTSKQKGLALRQKAA